MGADAEMPIDPSDDFAPGLFMIALAALCIALFLVGVGIAAAAVVAASLAALAGLGIVSSAVLIGLVRRRFSSGLRAFHYQICALLAVPAGIGTFWLGSYLTHSQSGPVGILFMGTVAGVASGLSLAFLFDRLAGALYRRFAVPGGVDRSPNA